VVPLNFNERTFLSPAPAIKRFRIFMHPHGKPIAGAGLEADGQILREAASAPYRDLEILRKTVKH
jgi:hypothetical protein